MEEERRVFTVDEVAKILGITKNLVYRQVRAGTIPTVKVGDRYLIPCAAFEKWLNDCHLKAEAVSA